MLNFTSNKTERLDKFLAAQIPAVSRGKIQKAIKDGLVSVNGQKIIEADHALASGDMIELPEFESTELKPSDIQLKVVFENSDLAVLDKQAGLLVHPAAGRSGDTLSHALLSRFPETKNVGDPMRPGIVHRLDEDTSGLIVIAKTQAAYEYLKSLFAGRTIEKHYLTLVHGVPNQIHRLIDDPITKSASHHKMSVGAGSTSGGKVGPGREAKTEYWVLGQGHIGLDQVALLKVKLHTGRTHQIRVHLSHIGHPVFGDQVYGGYNKLPDAKILDRQFLHSYKLKFKLLDGTWVEVFSDLPEALQQVLKQANIPYDDSKL